MKSYTIKVTVTDEDGHLIFNQEVKNPEELIKVAEVLPQTFEIFDSAQDLVKNAIYEAVGVPF